MIAGHVYWTVMNYSTRPTGLLIDRMRKHGRKPLRRRCAATPLVSTIEPSRAIDVPKSRPQLLAIVLAGLARS
jgi:hypothetical protein